MEFLTIEQMKTHIFPGVRNAISNEDDSLMQDAIDAAIAEAKGYCSRYDINALFVNMTKADPMLLQWVKSIAKWHFIGLSNPNIDYDDALSRYEQATKKLGEIQSGKLVPAGWPPATPKNRSQLFQVHSTTKKRNNHFNGINTIDPFNLNNL